MQGDLISRSALIEALEKHYNGLTYENVPRSISDFYSQIAEMIKEQPNAYDVEKVVAELEEVSFERYGKQGMGGEKVVNFDDLVEIVRNGGKE